MGKTRQEYIDYIKLELTGGILELEIDDAGLGKFVDLAMQKVQRYIDVTELITVPYASCIDMSGTEKKISSIFRVYRAEGFTGDSANGGIGQQILDPMYAQTWMAFTNGGTMYNLQDWVLNYLSYNTLLQMRNTTSTDLAWKQDHQANKLYINSGYDKPKYVTIEYVPRFEEVSQINSDYWIDIIQKLATAYVKVALGRIRTRFKQSNAQWEQDGETILAEGIKEKDALEEKLGVNSQIILPID